MERGCEVWVGWGARRGRVGVGGSQPACTPTTPCCYSGWPSATLQIVGLAVLTSTRPCLLGRRSRSEQREARLLSRRGVG